MTKEEAITLLCEHFSEGLVRTIVEALKQEQDEPVAYISSTKQNQLVSKAQYESMQEKNRAYFDIPLYTKPQSKQEQDEPYGYFRYDIRLDAWVKSLDNNKGVAFYTTPQTKEWVGLIDEDMEFLFPFGKSAWLTETIKVFEAKLKERNT
jgi:hypothetical protein